VNGNAGGALLGANGGELYAGFTGSFGALKLGVANTPTLTSQASRQPFGTKIGSGFSVTDQSISVATTAAFGTAILGSSHVRENNSIVYESPVMSGFQVQLGYALAELAVPNSLPQTGVAKSDLGIFYAAGPLAAGATFFNQSGINSLTTLYGSYVIGAAKIILGYHTEDKTVAGVTSTSKGTNIAGTYNFTPALAFLGNYARLDTQAINQDKAILALGLKYDLSKRTSLYTRYVKESMDNALVTQLSEQRTFLLGTQINF
jgi:predicted porin